MRFVNGKFCGRLPDFLGLESIFRNPVPKSRRFARREVLLRYKDEEEKKNGSEDVFGEYVRGKSGKIVKKNKFIFHGDLYILIPNRTFVLSTLYPRKYDARIFVSSRGEFSSVFLNVLFPP